MLKLGVDDGLKNYVKINDVKRKNVKIIDRITDILLRNGFLCTYSTMS